MLHRFTIPAGFVAITVIIVACGDLKNADPPSGSSGNGTTDSGTPGTTDSGKSGSSSSSSGSANGGGTGPGEHGALPNGYCCTSDADCRNRHCEDLGGGKLCRDECRFDNTCTRSDLAWKCEPTSGLDGYCRPSGAFTCLPADSFERGTRVHGDCCTASNDGNSGLECGGGLCSSTDDGPYSCRQNCEKSQDCPSGYVCIPASDSRKECAPANRPYTCK